MRTSRAVRVVPEYGTEGDATGACQSLHALSAVRSQRRAEPKTSSLVNPIIAEDLLPELGLDRLQHGVEVDRLLEDGVQAHLARAGRDGQGIAE